MNYTNIITTFFLITATFQFAAAKDLMIKVPVKCIKYPSCGDDISLSDAKKSYAQVLIEKKECLDEIKKSKKRLDGISRPSSLLGKYIGNLAPDKISCTLEVAAFNNVCGNAHTNGYYYDWAPSIYYSNGNEVLSEIIKRVSDGIVFDSKVIVETITSTSKERHLALCKVREVAGFTGPPRECVTVAIITPTEKWLRGSDPNITLCPQSASFRRSGAINIDFKVETKLKPHNFSSNIISMLTDSLGLFTDQEMERSSDGEIEYIYISKLLVDYVTH